MSVLMIILGIIMVIGGVVCLFTPVVTSFGVMYFFMILLFTIGIVFLIESIAYRRFLDFIFAVISLCAGGFILFSPNMSFITETILLYITAAWLIIRGILGIINAFRFRKSIGSAMFALALIVSILVVGAGIYSYIHPLFIAGFIGVLASCFFIVEGIDLVVAGCIGKDIKKAVSTTYVPAEASEAPEAADSSDTE